jgi:hypothetical protein
LVDRLPEDLEKRSGFADLTVDAKEADVVDAALDLHGRQSPVGGFVGQTVAGTQGETLDLDPNPVDPVDGRVDGAR